MAVHAPLSRARAIQSLEKSDDVYEMRKRRNYSDFWRSIPMEEPYRVILAEVRDKLYNTREALQEVISGKREALDPEDDSVFTSKEQLLEPLMACYQSLKEVGDMNVADGFLLDLIRQVTTSA